MGLEPHRLCPGSPLELSGTKKADRDIEGQTSAPAGLHNRGGYRCIPLPLQTGLPAPLSRQMRTFLQVIWNVVNRRVSAHPAWAGPVVRGDRVRLGGRPFYHRGVKDWQASLHHAPREDLRLLGAVMRCSNEC